MTEGSDPGALLDGIRILDLADGNASFCSKALADLGALVVKVEKPGGDGTRGVRSSTGGGAPTGGGWPTEADLTALYHDANKLGITLDIEKEEGRGLFLRLVAKADVVVESFPPGHLTSLGCGYEAMREANPGIVVASVTGFGQTGPHSGFAANDLVASAFGGQMYVSGDSSREPLRPYGGQSVYVASLFAAVGVVLALIKRRATGEGEHIDVSTQEAVAGTLDHVLVRYFFDGIVPKRQGDLSWNRTSFTLPCKDGHIYVNVGTQWETLVEWVAADGMAQDLAEERWRDEGYRAENIHHVIEVLRIWTLTHDRGHLIEVAQAMRFPWAPVARPDEILASPQLGARGFFHPLDHPGVGRLERQAGLLIPGPPYRIDDSPSRSPRPAPIPGQDNARIYVGEMGLSEHDLARLSRLGVI
ncbi:MAG: CaiB/BaiF CoA transferase family protein [Thermoleophilia bacterium]